MILVLCILSEIAWHPINKIKLCEGLKLMKEKQKKNLSFIMSLLLEEHKEMNLGSRMLG